MNKKLSLFVVITLLIVTTVVAESMQVYVDQPTSIGTSCIRNSQIRTTNVSVYVKIYDSSGNMISNGTSIYAGNSTFVYPVIFNQIGEYQTKETCDFGDFLADGSTLITVIKPGFGNMQVISQGVPQVNLDTLAKAEWLLLLPNATNQTLNSSIQVVGGNCIVSGITGNALNMTPLVITTNDRMTASFIANNTNGFVEGNNYEIECNISLSDGMYVNGVKSYVYVNSQASLWQQLLQLIGLAQDTNANVNATLSVANQTLQIVQGLNNTGVPTQVYEQVPFLSTTKGVSGYRGQPIIITTKLLQGSRVLNDSACSIDINDQFGWNNLVNYQPMNYDSNKELYYYNITVNDVGSYDSRINCSGGMVLNNSLVHDTTRLDIISGLRAVITK